MNLSFDEKVTTQEVVERIGYSTRQNLERWLKKDPRYGENIRHGFYPLAKKTKAVEMYQSGQYTVNEIASELDIPYPGTRYSWIYKARDEGDQGLIPKKRCANMPKVPKAATPEDLVLLKQRCEELKLDHAILKETIEILKKTQAPIHET